MQKPTDDIITSRLILRLMDKEVISDCLKKNLEGAEHLLKARIPIEMFDHPSSLKYALKQFEIDEYHLPWAARAIIIPEKNQMVGLVRFHSQPNPEYLKDYASNAVEFGYRIFKDYRKKGYATESVIAIVDWAKATFGVVNFIASVSPDNKDSLKLISGLGFKKIGEVMDEIDGLEFIFLKNINDD
nr:GNAT family N-acetyltransferase [Pedobacter sp. ASV2]